MKKKVLADTDILSFFMKKDKNVVANFEDYVNQNEYIYISRISVLEVLSGLKAKNATKQLEEFRDLIAKHKILEVTELSAELSSDIYAHLRKIGKHTGSYDILIAGIALANNLILATNNEKDYENIQGLEIVNWTLKVN